MTAMKSKRMRSKSNNLLARTLVPSLLAGFTIALLVSVLSYLRVDLAYGTGTSLVIFTSFASSIFIMFLMPHSTAAKSDKFVKSYVLAGIIGYVGSLGLAFMPLAAVAGLVVFVLALAMIATHSEHPPAAAIAFAFVLFKVGIIGILVIALGIMVILAVRFALERLIFRFEKTLGEEIKST